MLKILASRHSQKAHKIIQDTDISISFYEEKAFNDGTVQFEINQKNQNILLFHEFKKPFEIDAWRALSIARKISKTNNLIAIIAPFFPFLREKDENNKTYSCELFSEFKIITLDPHLNLKNIIPISSDEIFGDKIQKNDLLIFPDFGATKRYEKLFKNEFITGQKDRNKSTYFKQSDKIENRNCVIIDDILDTGFTISETTRQLRLKKAKSVKVFVTHCPNGISHFSLKDLDYLSTSDTLSLNDENFKEIIDCTKAINNYLRRNLCKLQN